MPGFYPGQDSEQVVWWSTFNQECIDRAATFPAILDAPKLALILACKNWIATLVNANLNVRNFAKEFATYKNIWLDSPMGTSVPAPPVPPAALAPPLGAAVGLESIARQIARQLNADPNMTDAIRAAMRISGAGSALGTVRILRADAVGRSGVALRFAMAGHKAVALYMKRGGVTTRIGTLTTADYTDLTAPLVPGQSESREYWIRGIVDNVEQGDISASVFVATTP